MESVVCFADDTMLFSIVKDSAISANDLNHDLNVPKVHPPPHQKFCYINRAGAPYFPRLYDFSGDI